MPRVNQMRAFSVHSTQHLAAFRSRILISHWQFDNVRFGSEADICSAIGHVCFTPNSDRESRHTQTVMSALPPKADMCGATAHVCFGPIADIDDISGYAAIAGKRGVSLSACVLWRWRRSTDSDYKSRDCLPKYCL